MVEDRSPTGDAESAPADSQLTGVLLFLGGRVAHADATTLHVEPSRYHENEVAIDVSTNAGPLVGTETDGGEWKWERREDWAAVSEGTKVCASVRPTETGELEAVKVFVHAVCSFQPAPDS